jgi:hypothetical protein
MLEVLQRGLVQTAIDLLPIALILGFFWARFLRADRALVRRTLIGVLHIGAGLTLFRFGLEGTLLPLGAGLATALSDVAVSRADALGFSALVGFAVALGGAAALIEPTLAATADRVRDLSGGAVRPMVLRVAVAAGIGFGLGIGVLRLILGLPIGAVLAPLVAVAAALALAAPRGLVPLAFDCGAIATSIVTVPMIAAYGVAVAERLPGRSALADGFGLVALAMLGSAISVLIAALIAARPRQARPIHSNPRGEEP